MHSSNSNTLTDNIASNNSEYGIYLYSSTVNGITNNIVSNNDYGIYLYSSSYNTLMGNTANSNDHPGIYLYLSPYNTLTDNTANSNYDGFLLDIYCNNNNLTGNTASNNPFGISLDSSSNNYLTGNTANSNNYSGIRLHSSSNTNTITGNTALNNSYGIALSSSNNNLMYNNYFNNTNNAQDYGTNIWNISKTFGTNIIGGSNLGGNYWSDYTGEDLGDDGLGDTQLPYNASGNIVNGGDWLPLVAAPFAHFSLDLAPGFNLISIPLELTDRSLAAVVGSNAVAMDEIYEFDNVAGYSSSIYTGAAWAGAVTALQPGRGYWYNRKGAPVTINVTGSLPAGHITTPIYTGWNLLGYQSMQSQGLGIVTAPVAMDEIYEFDNVAGYSSSMYTGAAWAGAVTGFEPGNGYWYNRKGSPFDWVYTP